MRHDVHIRVACQALQHHVQTVALMHPMHLIRTVRKLFPVVVLEIHCRADVRLAFISVRGARSWDWWLATELPWNMD